LAYIYLSLAPIGSKLLIKPIQKVFMVIPSWGNKDGFVYLVFFSQGIWYYVTIHESREKHLEYSNSTLNEHKKLEALQE
jgi:hypothetical protein